MIIRFTSPKKTWLLFNLVIVHHQPAFLNWYINLSGPQKIHGLHTFKGINITSGVFKKSPSGKEGTGQ